jgi:ABC-2 type transport system ATP-binding protein
VTVLPPPTTPPVSLAEPVIRFSGVSKFFGQLVAVSDVTFDLGPGVTSLLGPNGAGKSTALRLLTGQAVPSKGEVRILGADPRDRGVARLIGVAPQQETLFESQTAREFVRLAATLQGLPDPEGAARRVLAQVELDADDGRAIATYSKGMRQRVKLAQAIVHDPQVIVLDEPLTGLDPRQRLAMIDLLKQFGADGRSVIVSSHVLEEVERIGSRVLVISKGRLAAEGDFRAIRELMNDRPHELRIRTDRARPLAMGLVGLAIVRSVEVDGDIVTIETNDMLAFGQAIAPLAVRLDCTIDELTPLNDDLESVFRFLVGP